MIVDRVLFVQTVCQNLVFPGHNTTVSIFIFTPGVPDTPPPEILLTPCADTPYPHPISLSPPHPRASPQTSSRSPTSRTANSFSQNTNVTKFTIFFQTHSHVWLQYSKNDTINLEETYTFLVRTHHLRSFLISRSGIQIKLKHDYAYVHEFDNDNRQASTPLLLRLPKDTIVRLGDGSNSRSNASCRFSLHEWKLT